MSTSSLGHKGFDGLPMGHAAIIVGINLTDGPGRAEGPEDLDELAALLQTLGIPEKARVVQNRRRLSAHSLIGSGKAEEIRLLAEQVGADMIIFDRALTGPQIKNLEQLCCCAVMDRTGVILEIFSRHARSKQAKTQVEIARLEYALSRLSGAWTHFQRQKGGGVRSRGMGEKQIEVDRREVRSRIARLRQRLVQIEKECALRRKQRAKEWKVALVGYTNSGKTTLMKELSRSQNEGRDELFATLDTQIKTIDPSTKPKILISDTVGFIRNLPHGLIESFKSTLAEVVEADLIVHVVDVSHPNYQLQMATADQVLIEIGAGKIAKMVCFNKLDLLEDPVLPRILRGVYAKSSVISSFNRQDIESLRDKIYRFFGDHMEEAILEVSQSDVENQSKIFAHCLIMNSDYTEPSKVVFTVKATGAVLDWLQPAISGCQRDLSGGRQLARPHK